MAKRPRLTTQDVLYATDSSDDEDFEVDDPDEPFMDGSDDEFEDPNGEDDDNMDVSPPYSPQGTLLGASPDSSPDSSPASTPTSLPRMWTTSLQPVAIQPFHSPAGSTVSIPESPLEVFHLLFITP